jgi:hypothetical protein
MDEEPCKSLMADRSRSFALLRMTSYGMYFRNLFRIGCKTHAPRSRHFVKRSFRLTVRQTKYLTVIDFRVGKRLSMSDERLSSTFLLFCDIVPSRYWRDGRLRARSAARDRTQRKPAEA